MQSLVPSGDVAARVALVPLAETSACTSRTFAPAAQSQTRAVPSTDVVANAVRWPSVSTRQCATSSGCACTSALAVPVAISTSHALPADVVTTPHGSGLGFELGFDPVAPPLPELPASKLAATTAPSSSSSPTSSHPTPLSALIQTLARLAPPTNSLPPGSARTAVTASPAGRASQHLASVGTAPPFVSRPTRMGDRHTRPRESPTNNDPSPAVDAAVHTGLAPVNPLLGTRVAPEARSSS
mmetsp:Transcript_7888/g.32484  ORF Transcript_7888/g.32484 Transcript_7888/m.32484 type:complete len:241 (+) Transcript_7888:955-1677(+)